MMLKLKLLSILVLLSYALTAQDMVYKPKNPAFGGDTFNYQWLLSGAQAQDTYENPQLSATSGASTSDLDDFKASLKRNLLSTLSRQIISDQFGETNLTPGNYSFGDFNVEISNSLDGILIDIVDQLTGESTQVLVPFF